MDATNDEQFLQALLNAPAMKPPPGVHPNFADRSNLQQIVIAVLTFYMVLATLFILMRMCTKLFILRKVVLEDCTS